MVKFLAKRGEVWVHWQGIKMNERAFKTLCPQDYEAEFGGAHV